MGSLIEFNDTLKLNSKVFPNKLEEGKEYSFKINERRIFHLFPVRVFLVEEIDGKWNYRGHIQILELKISAIKNNTSGRFKMVKLYDSEYIKLVNANEAPQGEEYLGT